MDEDYWQGKRANGIKDTINISQYCSLIDLWQASVAKYNSQPAFSSFNHTLTFQQIDINSRKIANYFREQTDLVAGDRIAVMIPNCFTFPIVTYAVLMTGMILVPINPMYTTDEVCQQLQDSGASAVIVLNQLIDKIMPVTELTAIRYIFTSNIFDFIPAPKRWFMQLYLRTKNKNRASTKQSECIPLNHIVDTFSPITLSNIYKNTQQDLAIIQYTGGTTGKPKGVMLTHKNLIANTLQATEVLNCLGEHNQHYFEHGCETIIAPLPLYHIYALSVHLFIMTHIGNHSVLIINPANTAQMIADMRKVRFTALIGLNTLFLKLLANHAFKKIDFKHLKVTLSGGMALTNEIATKWKLETGCAITEAYGLSECAPGICMNALGSWIKAGTVGFPFPATALKIINNQDQELPPGEMGELCVKGPQVTPGYWMNPEFTNQALKNGWLHTGDIAIIQKDGFVKILDRLKDMVVVSGFNVYPSEIENIVLKYPHVSNCAVIGQPHPQTGESLKLFIVTTNTTLTHQEISNHCRQHLAAYKIPSEIIFRNQLPTSSVGKILKKNLR